VPPTERPVEAPAAGGSSSPPPIPETPPIPDRLLAQRDRPRPPPIYDAPADPPPEGDAFHQAVGMSRKGLYGQAAGLLEAVANAGGENAGLALYDYGRIQQLNLGHPDLALAAYQRYEREYPRGPMLQEVELSAIELELASPKPDRALAHMDGFLEQFPKGERAPNVHLLRGNLLRKRGDFKGALSEYTHARAPGIEDDALYFSAWCQQRLGRASDAAASLRDYQERFPQGRHAAEVRRAMEGH
jgi:tetratricopeptide (TPR) repeat protein